MLRISHVGPEQKCVKYMGTEPEKQDEQTWALRMVKRLSRVRGVIGRTTCSVARGE